MINLSISSASLQPISTLNSNTSSPSTCSSTWSDIKSNKKQGKRSLDSDISKVKTIKQSKQEEQEEQENLPQSNNNNEVRRIECELSKEEKKEEIPTTNSITSGVGSGSGGIGELLRICKTKLGGLKQETKTICSSLEDPTSNSNNKDDSKNTIIIGDKIESESKQETKEPEQKPPVNQTPPNECTNIITNPITTTLTTTNTNNINSNRKNHNNNIFNSQIQPRANNSIIKSQRPLLEQTLSNLVPILPKPAITTTINKKSTLLNNSFIPSNSIINTLHNPTNITTTTIATNLNTTTNNNSNNNNIVVIQKQKNKLTTVESRNQRFEEIKSTYEQLINEIKINTGKF